MLCVIGPAAHGGQPAPLVAVEVELQHLNRLADNAAFARHRDFVLEGLPEGPKLFGLPIRVCGDLLDEFSQFAVPSGLLHLRPPPRPTPQRSLARSRNEGSA
jgi:hypothetical protein